MQLDLTSVDSCISHLALFADMVWLLDCDIDGPIKSCNEDYMLLITVADVRKPTTLIKGTSSEDATTLLNV